MVVIPVGQEVQFVEPATEYIPVGHLIHKFSVSCLNVPASQTEILKVYS